MAARGSISSVGSSKRDSLWDPGLQGVLENESGQKIMREVAEKKKIRRARLLFEASIQSKPPSKDFVSLVITEQGIIWRKWKITLRGFTMGAAPVPQPQEEVMSITDFRCNDTLMDEIKRTFGESTFNHIERILLGSNDPLSCTPEALMVRICSMLDLQSISQLSQVNRYLRCLCASDKLWNLLYSQHQGNPTSEICTLANDISWKKVFYLNKLQLQKELSRRRPVGKMATPSSMSPSARTSTTSDRNSLLPTSNSPAKSISDNILNPRGSTPAKGSATRDSCLPRESVASETGRGSNASTVKKSSGQDAFLTQNV